MKIVILIFLGLVFESSLLSQPQKKESFDWKVASLIAIQDRGRIKPMDTFARETLEFVTSKKQWKGMEAIECLFGWLIAFDKDWEDEPFIKVDYEPLKKVLGLKVDEHFFSPKTIRENENIQKEMQKVIEKEKNKEKLNEFEKKLVQLVNQKNLLDSILSGQSFTILANPKGINETWFPLVAMNEREAIPYTDLQMQKLAQSLKSMIESFMASDAKIWNATIIDFSLVLKEASAGNYPANDELSREIHYNSLRPFKWSWIAYTISFIFLMIAIISNKKMMGKLGMLTLLGAFAMHAYGFTLRCLIGGRPPVTNMYESVIWVAWGCILFSIFIYLAYKNYAIPAAATVFSIIGLILADSLPLALDPSIHPLEPVLRSNYWLTIHVLTITLSYAAFALSLCLGNVALGFYLFSPKKVPSIQEYSLYMYRAMQIGVILLAAGTILGGVWADYSWGRFWGWDPKEVWALTALLFYLAVLHGRFTGWIKGFGFVCCTVVSFLAILMAWYGVNFVLGVGLHSYGFSSGGTLYVSLYILAQVIFILLAYMQYKKSGLSEGVGEKIFPTKK